MVTRNRKKVVKNDINRLFKNSMLTGIPQIVEASNWTKRLVRSLVFVVCAGGFIYQTLSFMNVYWKYETVVDIQVLSPSIIDKPAYTVCSDVGFMSSRFCPTINKEFTKRTGVECETLEDSENYEYCFCHPRMCDKFNKLKNVTLVKPEGYDWIRQQPWDYLKQFMITDKDFMDRCYDENAYFGYARLSCKNTNNYSIQVPCYSNDDYLESCFTRNSVYGKPDEPIERVLSFGEQIAAVNFFELEYPVDQRDPKLFISFHSPYTIKNPMKEGFVMERLRTYTYRLSKVIKNLLPYPYETDCIDYMTMWRARGGKGPTNLNECIQECLRNRSMEVHGCLIKGINYPGFDIQCASGKVDEDLVPSSKECIEKTCKPACYEEHFVTSADSSEEPTLEEDCYKPKLLEFRAEDITLMIFYSGMKTTVYTYRPKYEDIETFSYIGGYIGMWLGISLIAVFDFLETMVMLMRYPLRRMRRWREKNKINRFNSEMKRVY